MFGLITFIRLGLAFGAPTAGVETEPPSRSMRAIEAIDLDGDGVDELVLSPLEVPAEASPLVRYSLDIEDLDGDGFFDLVTVIGEHDSLFFEVRPHAGPPRSDPPRNTSSDSAGGSCDGGAGSTTPLLTLLCLGILGLRRRIRIPLLSVSAGRGSGSG